jgi:hypothetical protein
MIEWTPMASDLAIKQSLSQAVKAIIDTTVSSSKTSWISSSDHPGHHGYHSQIIQAIMNITDS